MKKGWKIFLWIIGIIVALILIGLIYFFFFFQMSTSSLCTSNDKIMEDYDKITCESVESCKTLLIEDVRKEMLKDVDTADVATQKLTDQIVIDISNQIVACDKTCKVKDFRLIELTEQCGNTESRYDFKIDGKTFLSLM